jgi:bifunctional DNA-binding transcriptional regulator/antitoxin component of YhaV-PrlF toxin-antitoxin module
MTTTLDQAGRVVIPAKVRRRPGPTAGTELEMGIEGFARAEKSIPADSSTAMSHVREH